MASEETAGVVFELCKEVVDELWDSNWEGVSFVRRTTELHYADILKVHNSHIPLPTYSEEENNRITEKEKKLTILK